MRENLFRGKFVGTGKWVYGSLLTDIYGSYPCILRNASLDDDSELHFEFTPVEPTTISQYTGSCDKNGTKIFDGDIVKIPVWRTYGNESGTFAKGVVEFCDCAFSVLYENDTRRNFIGYLDNLEVIGNIFDNPDLFERCST